MARKLWELIGAVVVLTIVLVILIQAVTPYLWIIGVGVALIVVALLGKVVLFRKRF